MYLSSTAQFIASGKWQTNCRNPNRILMFWVLARRVNVTYLIKTETSCGVKECNTMSVELFYVKWMKQKTSANLFHCTHIYNSIQFHTYTRVERCVYNFIWFSFHIFHPISSIFKHCLHTHSSINDQLLIFNQSIAVEHSNLPIACYKWTVNTLNTNVSRSFQLWIIVKSVK